MGLRRRLLRSLARSAIVLLCMALQVPGAFADTIRIGEVNPLTGKLAKHGVEIHEGILAAVEEVNGRGGISGKAVELASRDDQSLPEVAINQTEDLLYREKVVGLVGGYVDALVGPISELAAKRRIPYVASASLQRSLAGGRQNPYFFRVSRLDGVVKPLCEFVIEMVHPKSAAILYAATPGATEFGGNVEACLQDAGVAIPIVEKFRAGVLDFSSFLLKVRQSEPGILISGGFYPDHLILIRQLREQKIPLRVYLAPWGVAYPSFIEELGQESEGLLGLCAWNPGITFPGTERESVLFTDRFSRRFGKSPNTTTMHGYTSARALLAAIEHTLQAGHQLSGDRISEQLRSLDLILPMGHLAFDRNGDPKYYEQVVVQIQKGKLVAVYPPQRATGKFIEY